MQRDPTVIRRRRRDPRTHPGGRKADPCHIPLLTESGSSRPRQIAVSRYPMATERIGLQRPP